MRAHEEGDMYEGHARESLAGDEEKVNSLYTLFVTMDEVTYLCKRLKYSIEGSDAGMHYTEKEVYHLAYPRLPITNPYKYILNHDDKHQTTESGMDFHA